MKLSAIFLLIASIFVMVGLHQFYPEFPVIGPCIAIGYFIRKYTSSKN